ncbi:MAG TPA: hypothetical protein VJN41_03735, partial [Alphaproteobacteria bacterium]|nr:hypothetical protein [Alphaproteobacteria bacterium]
MAAGTSVARALARWPRGAGLAALVLVAACAVPTPPSERLTLVPVSFDALEGWADDRQEEALAAFQRSCAPLLEREPEAPVKPEPIGG